MEDAAKLMRTLRTERDLILADARDDARRIIEEAQEATFVEPGAVVFDVSAPPDDPREPFVAPELAEDNAPPVRVDDVWPVDPNAGAPDDTIASRNRAGTWRRRRRLWYEPYR